MSSLRTLPFHAFKVTYDALSPTPLRRIPGMLALSNVIFRWVWRGGNIIEVQGNKMYIDVFDPSPALRKTFQAYAMNLVHEEATTRLFRKLLHPGNVVLDLGANIGYFTLIAARAVGATGRVVSFEPERRNFWYLSKNVSINGLKQVTTHQMAIAEKSGWTKLYLCSYDSGHHTINQFQGIAAISRGRRYQEEAVDIRTVRVDDILDEMGIGHVDVIKMDVEGAEALAVAGMRKTLLQNNVKVFLEFFPILMEKMGTNPRAYIESLLNDFGFRMYAVGRDHDLSGAPEDLISVKSYAELASMLHAEDAHVNLFLSKESPR